MPLPDPIPMRFAAEFVARVRAFAASSGLTQTDIIRRAAERGLRGVIASHERRFTTFSAPRQRRTIGGKQHRHMG